MQEGYDPIKYYMDLENDPFSPDCQIRHKVNHREEFIIGSEQGTMFSTKIGTVVCSALNDTGATRCCMSEVYYRKLQLPEILTIT